MAKLTEKQYLDLAQKVGIEKMKAIEQASGGDTGLLETTDRPTKTKKLKPVDSKIDVSLDCSKEEFLKTMKEQGCTVADYNLVKFGEPDYVLFDHKETKSQTEQIIALHEELVSHLISAYDLALRIGEMLINLKENHIQHRKFGAWMKQNLPFSIRTGQRYMQVYLHHEDLSKKGITSLTDAYHEINGDPLNDEVIETDDSTNTKKKWKVVSTTAEVDDIKLPKKKLKGPQGTFEINQDVLERIEQGRFPFDKRYTKIVVTIPSSEKYKSLLSVFIVAASDLLVSGGKLIFVKK